MKNQTKSVLGWLSIFILSIIPVIIFLSSGNGERFISFSSFVYNLGRMTALAGVTLFAINFILSTRLKFLEEIFGGMDKVYLVHGIVGGIAFLLILAHPLLIVAGMIPEGSMAILTYVIPGGILSIDFGLLAILGFISLIFITFFTKMRYHHWKFTHEFMGAIFLFAVVHMLLVKSSVSLDSIFPGYYVFVASIGFIGLAAFTYSLIARKKMKYFQYRIKEVKTANKVTELELFPENPEKKIKYQSGQFVFLRFENEKLTKEPHPFSISSASGEDLIKIKIKSSGDFTEKLHNLKKGDKVSVEGPYGKFHFKNFENRNQIWIAGGIGITPFLGMAEELEKNPEFNVNFFYTFIGNSIMDEQYLEKISSMKNLKFTPWDSEKKGLISMEELTPKEEDVKDSEFLICGPVGFKNAIIGHLKKIGVEKSRIHEEVFDLK